VRQTVTSRWLGSVYIALVALVAPHTTVAQAVAQEVADINANPGRFVNTTVKLQGTVTSSELRPEGTLRGYYVLADDSDNRGIRVLTSLELPAVGTAVSVTGTVRQDPQNTQRVVVREERRGAAGRDLIRYAIIGGAALAVLLIGVLVYMMTRPMEQPSYKPRRPQPMEDETQVYGGSGDVTETFEDWGVQLRIVEGAGRGETIPIGTSPFHIGRSGGARKNHLDLQDRTVSRTQATIRRNGKSGSFSIQNDGDRNPTIIDGKSVDAQELRPGMQIRLGATVLVFEQTHG
jgi:hypothetical protein